MPNKQKRNKNRTDSKQRKQSKLSKVLSSSKNSIQATSKYFQELTPFEIYSSVKKIENHRHFKKATKLTQSRSFENIFFAVLPDSTLPKTIAWMCGLIASNKENIEFAINAEKEITQHLLQGEIQKAYKKCLEIDNKCGDSLWSYKTKQAILSKRESEKTEEDNLKIHENSLLDFIIKNCLQFSGETDFFTVTSESLWNNIIRSSPEEFRDTLLYHLFPLNGEYNYDISMILRYEKSTSILDIYHSLVNCIYLLKFQNHQEVGDSERSISDLLSNAINDETIFNFARRSGKRRPFRLINNNLYDLYQEGKYEKICRTFNSTKDTQPSFQETLLIIESNIRSKNLKTNGFFGELVENLEKVILKSAGHDKSREHLLCTAYTFRTLPWFRDLSIFLQSEIPFSSRERRENYLESLLMSEQSNNPDRTKVFSPTIQHEYIAAVKSSSDKNTAISIYQYLNDPSIKKLASSRIETDLATYYTALRSFKNEDYKSASSNLLKVSESKDRYLASIVKGISAEALILSGKMNDGVKRLVDEFIKGDGAHKFDVRNILQLIKKEYRNKSEIDYPIAISILSRYISNEMESDLQYSFEIFLEKNNLEYPQDLFDKYEIFDKEKLTYFLKWICTQDIMSMYLKFNTTDEIEECRMEVCQHLVAQGDKSQRILSEIKEINKARAVKRAAKKIDTSRIFVDTSSLTGRFSSQYRDLFERYQNLLTQDFSQFKDEMIFEEQIALWRNYQKEKGISEPDFIRILSSIYIPDVKINKKNAIFLSLVKLIRDEFTHGEKGLNNHLSTRIRHGVLPTTLRMPIKEEGLYIPDSKTLKNFIEEENRPVDNGELEHIFNSLKSLSKNIDKIISDINDEWLQIVTLDSFLDKSKKSSHKNAIFNYSISPLESYGIQKNLTPSANYDDLVYVTVDWLWRKTEELLLGVQEKIKNIALVSIYEEIEKHKVNLSEKIGDTNYVRTICNSLDRVKNGFSRQVEIANSWFTHSEHDSDEEYDFEFAIDIAKKCIGVNPKVTSNLLLPQVKGRQLNYLVDVFIILFENATSKSGLEKNELDLSCDIEQEQRLTKITISNRCRENQVRESDIQFYNEAYGDESFADESASREGGTGFFKIWSALKRGLGITHNLLINFQDNVFRVEISISDLEKRLST